jgi:hypothetical protein
VVLPLTQVIVTDFLATGATEGAADGVGVGVGVGAVTTFSCVNFTLIVGEEKVKPLAERYNQPFFSLTIVVATFFSPSEDVIEISA